MSFRATLHTLSGYLPRLGLSALILCLVSGVVLCFHYRPFGNVFQNVEEITTLVPYGRFIRQFHYGSGQLFVILMLLHTADHFLRKRYRTYSLAEWTRLTFSLWLCLFALFTGFILKGDLEALFAGRIFMNLLKSLPLMGEPLSRVLMVPGDRFFFIPYLHHCLFLPVLIGYFMKAHIREWLPNPRFLLGVATGLFLYALLINPHMAIPPKATMERVTGPWFFLGIQTLLKTMPPVVAGILLPGLFVGCVLVMGMAGGGSRRAGAHWIWPFAERTLRLVVIISFCLYGVLTIRALFKGP